MENTNKHSMNIFEFFTYFFTDKWSFNGALGVVFTFFSQFLVSFTDINAAIGVGTALIGLCIAILSFYKMSIQVAKERFEYDQLVKGNKTKDDESE